jgi:hypothetical protein
MLTKCVNCGFYVSNLEPECPNCGRQTSLRNKTGGYLKILPLPFFFAAFFSAILAFPASLFWFGQTFDVSNYLTFAILIFVFLFLLFFRLEIKKHQHENEQIESKTLSILDKNLKTIENRLADLNARARKIDVVLDKIKVTDGGNLQEVRRKLLSAREIINSQAARYELKKQEIRLVNLQNDASPYLFKLHRLSEIETENGLETIANTKTEIKEIRRHLTDFAAIDFPGKSADEKQNFLSQLAETENSCEKLREALLSKQAARALQNLSPIEENIKLTNTKEIAHATETFNIETSLTDFSESFDELEREYQRLQSEIERNQNLLIE